MDRHYKDITGQKFERLTVIEFVGVNPVGRSALWKCKCECGNDVVVRGTNLRNGVTKSCGCLLKEYYRNKPKSSAEKTALANTTHGCTHDRLFKIWTSMRSRCRNSKTPAYKWYGAKGVRVCKEWDESYLAFKKWAYANGYDDTAPMHHCSIDRIDVNGDYCPENCRWADVKTQAENKTTVRMIEYNGEKHSIAEWARIYGVHRDTLRWRLNKLGWPIEKALTYKPWECNRKENGDRGS